MSVHKLIRNHDFQASLFLTVLAAIVLSSVRTQIFYKGDYAGYLTLELAVRDALKDGVLPMWNIIYSETLLGNPQAAIFYLPLMLLRPLPLYLAMEISLIAHTALAGIGTYFLLRDLNLRRSAAIFGSIAFMLSGTTIFRIAAGHIALVHALPWIVWGLFSYRRFLQNPNWRYLILTSFFIALLGYSGHPQWSLYGALIPGGYFLYTVISNWGDWTQLKKEFLGSIAIGLLVIGLLMIQLLPTLEHITQTTRGSGLTLAEANSAALPPNGLAAIFAPFTTGELFPQVGKFSHEYATYAGILTIGFAVLSIKASNPKKRRLARLFGIMCLGALLLSLGTLLPFYRIIYWLSQGFFRVPGRFLLIFTSCLSFMAAIGFDSIQDYIEANSYLWRAGQFFSISLAIFSCLVNPILGFIFSNDLSISSNFPSLFYSLPIIIVSGVALGISQKIKSSHWQWLIVGVLIVDLVGFTVYVANWKDHTWPSAYADRNLLKNAPVSSTQVRIPIKQGALSMQGMPVIFKHQDSSPRIDTLLSVADDNNTTLKWFSALYFISPTMEIPDNSVLIEDFSGVSLFESPENLPRVYAASEFVVAATEEEALAFILDENFDPYTTVVTSEEINELSENAVSIAPPTITAQFLTYNAETVEVSVNLDQAAMVIFSEPYFEGWQATVDGETASIFQVNYAFRGIFVEEGTHLVKMKMVSDTFSIGAAITGMTLLIILLITLLKRRSS